MSALDVEHAAEPILAWRIWRVIDYQTVDGRVEPRLTAATAGLPWPPRVKSTAVCITQDANHDAPQPDHTCGIWALRSRERAERLLCAWSKDSGGDWAIGHVSLWGAVVESELGYRAEFAYPYSLTVYGMREEAAAQLRAAYAVDVDWAPSAARLERDRRAAEREAEREKREKLEAAPVVPLAFTDEDVLVALAAAAARLTCFSWFEGQFRPTAVSTLIVPALRLLKGLGHETSRRQAVSDGLRVSPTLRRLEEAGLVESGTFASWADRSEWRLSDAGLAVLGRLSLPPRLLVPDWGNSPPKEVETTGVIAHLRRPAQPFWHEITARRDETVAARRAAQRRGRQAYRAWLEEWRATLGGLSRLAGVPQ